MKGKIPKPIASVPCGQCGSTLAASQRQCQKSLCIANICAAFRQIVLLALITIAASVHSVALADNSASLLVELDLPGGATIDIVSEHSVHNGLAMAIAAFQSPDSSASVLSFYRALWQPYATDKLPGFVESTLPGWSLISRVSGEHQVVVQLSTEHTQGSTGFVSVMPIHAAPVLQNHGVFSSLKPLSRNRTRDGADTSTITVYASPSSVSSTHIRYRRRLLEQGWRLLADTEVEQGWMTIMSRDTARLEISFLHSPDHGSALVAHEVVSQ